MPKRVALAAAYLVVSVGFAAGSPAGTQTLTLTSVNAPGHWSEEQGIKPFMACVQDATNSSIIFNYFDSGKIANQNASLDVLTKGAADISFIVPSALSDKMPINNIPMLPDMGDTTVQMTRAYRTVINNPDSPYSKELKGLGVVPLILNVFPPYQIMERTQPFKTMADFKGKKIRVAGGAQTFAITAIGAIPVQIGFAEIYVAMQQGTVDAFVFATTPLESLSLQEVTKAMTRNGNFGGAIGLIGMGQNSFSKLSPENQKILIGCGLKSEDHLAHYADTTNEQLFDKFSKMGIDVYALSPETLAALQPKLKLAQDDFVSRLEKRGLPGKVAFDEWNKALGR
jgi:TRAP-type C4-dicarboxylate transport system substrate-binding protein